MNARTLMLALAGGGLVLLLIKSFQIQPPQSPKAQMPGSAPVVSLVEETLHQHEGEHSPFVEAFEQALHAGEPQDAKPA